MHTLTPGCSVIILPVLCHILRHWSLSNAHHSLNLPNGTGCKHRVGSDFLREMIYQPFFQAGRVGVRALKGTSSRGSYACMLACTNTCTYICHSPTKQSWQLPGFECAVSYMYTATIREGEGEGGKRREKVNYMSGGWEISFIFDHS